MTKTTYYVKGLVTLAVMVASLLAMPDIAHAYQVHVSISGAGLVTETTPANLLQACSSPPTTPTGVIDKNCYAGTPDGAYGWGWVVRYEATPAPGYNFVRWQSDGGSNPVICDNATSDTYTGSICQFATYRDLQTRAVFADTTRPLTPEIASGPNQSVNGPATFAYSLPRSDPTFERFECRVGVIRDGAIVSYLHEWQACGSDPLASEISEDPAGDGTYRLEVRARDYSANYSATIASRDWTVDKTAPQTTLNSAVGPAEGSIVASRSASFQFSMDEAGSFQCQLDAGFWDSCSSPASLSDLSDGSHTFRVRAVDTAGNVDDTSAKRNWTVDTIKPKVTGATPTGTGVKRNINITATFSEKMNRSTLTKSTFKLYKVNADGSTTQITIVTVTLNFDALKATLNPFGTSSTVLAKNSRYKVVVTTEAKDLANNPLDQDPTTTGNQPKIWYFKTGLQ